MIIQWFPGHMTKALRMMESEIKAVDVVIYVLDSRAPFSCVNPKFEKLIGDKKIIFVLNKADLGEDKKILEWQKYFTEKSSKCITINSTTSNSSKTLIKNIYLIMKDKIAKYKAKNINTTIRAMVIGVPNSGKSTLINNLCGKGKTVTGDKPGVTKGKQWVKVDNNIEVLDTPGTLWPSFNNNTIATHLAFIGSISENVLDESELVYELIKDLVNIDKRFLINRYNIEIKAEDNALNIFDNICESRKFVMKNGEMDYDRCAKAILKDFKSGKIGKVTLETTKDIKNLKKNDRKDNV